MSSPEIYKIRIFCINSSTRFAGYKRHLPHSTIDENTPAILLADFHPSLVLIKYLTLSSLAESFLSSRLLCPPIQSFLCRASLTPISPSFPPLPLFNYRSPIGPPEKCQCADLRSARLECSIRLETDPEFEIVSECAFQVFPYSRCSAIIGLIRSIDV